MRRVTGLSTSISLLLTVLLTHSGSPEAAEKPETWTEPVTGLSFVRLPKGCYPLGAPPALLPPGVPPPADPLHPKPDELPRHEVCVDGIWLGETEVTQQAWRIVMGTNPSSHPADGSFPVESISWPQAVAFAAKLGEVSRGPDTFRLPTEAEWEYACRSGGQEEIFSGARDLQGTHATVWRGGNGAIPTPTRTGGMKPNGFGLYDMSGNVAEWVRDSYAPDAYPRHPLSNPLIEVADEPRRGVRGGSHLSGPAGWRCASRGQQEKDTPSPAIGLRLVRVPEVMHPADIWVFRSQRTKR